VRFFVAILRFFDRPIDLDARRGERIRAVEFICGCELAWVMGATLQAPTRLNLMEALCCWARQSPMTPHQLKALWARLGLSR
jgi:hypothetical protein